MYVTTADNWLWITPGAVMKRPDDKVGRDTDRLEYAERRLRVASMAVRLVKDVVTLSVIIALIAL